MAIMAQDYMTSNCLDSHCFNGRHNADCITCTDDETGILDSLQQHGFVPVRSVTSSRERDLQFKIFQRTAELQLQKSVAIG
jgi:hypothetical protein